MRLTNRFNLPDPIVRAVSRDPYSKGAADFSVTELIDSPRVRALRERHEEEIVEDVSDLMFSLLGRAVHQILEWGAREGHKAEERLFYKVGGFTISGAMDLQSDEYDGIVISDYKVTTVSSFMADKSEWHKQLNIYKYLFLKNRKHGDNRGVSGLKIVAILRDWTSAKAGGANYPPAPVQTLDIPMWDDEDIEKYVESRVAAHARAHADAFTDITRLPPCSPEERWEGSPYFAVIKKGNVRATCTVPTLKEAEEEVAALVATKKGEYEIVRRGGEPKRCAANWCKVAQWCDQYAQSQAEKAA